MLLLTAMKNRYPTYNNNPSEVLSISQLNSRARQLLEDVFARVQVEGEISNLARPASGHVYFTLKDSGAQIRCALFRQRALYVRHLLKDGLAVQVQGKVSLFESRGDYQLIADSLEPAGEGALRLAFEQLKEKLADEGLFAVEHKQALPCFPRRVAIVTSPSGAVIRDIISVFRRRSPCTDLVLIPSAVQGKEATGQLIQALQMADSQSFDAIILARGGGSLEDLWCFNEEALARAIYACITPVVSAVGHEMDVTIADFTADVRAPTPSAAAELLAPHMQALLSRLSELRQRLGNRLQQTLQLKQQSLYSLRRRLRHPGDYLLQRSQRLDSLDMRLRYSMERLSIRSGEHLGRLQNRLAAQHPQNALQLYQQRLNYVQRRLRTGVMDQLQQRRYRLNSLSQGLHLISPLATLQRGYSILLDSQGTAICDTTQVQPGQLLQARLAHGFLQLEVTTSKETEDTNLS